jgi:deazaflavin-dependent oxidoreductase (nitroreductase family)
MARFNLQYTNRITRHIAPWAPNFALLTHVGRTSGRSYETPVNVFRVDGRYVFAMTYGESQWVKNVMAAGECQIRTRRHDLALIEPERLHDPTRHLIPVPFRWILKLVGVDDFLLLRDAGRASD